MKRKLNNTADCQHAPPSPSKTPDSLADDILKIITELDANDQNKVMEALNNKYAAIRYDAYEKARQQEKETGVTFERFMAISQGIQEFLKARQEAKDLSK